MSTDGPQKQKYFSSQPQARSLERIILPAMKNGQIVICDRFTDSTRMYQGMRGPKLKKLVDILDKEVVTHDPI